MGFSWFTEIQFMWQFEVNVSYLVTEFKTYVNSQIYIYANDITE